jgi:hypothetical protein
MEQQEKEEIVQLIAAGHYRKKFSTGDNQEIIRILGPGNRKDYWKSMDGKEYSNSDLLDNWEAINTAPNTMHIDTQKRLFEGFDKIAQEAPSEPAHGEGFQEPKIGLVPDEKKELELFNRTVREPSLKVAEQGPHTLHMQVMEEGPKVNSFIDELFSKLAKSGDTESFEVTVKIPLPFNMDKLRESINLLDLDTLEVTKYVVDNLVSLNKVRNSLGSAIQRELVEPRKQVVSGTSKLRDLVEESKRPDQTSIEQKPVQQYGIDAAHEASLLLRTGQQELFEPKESIDERINELENATKKLLGGYMEGI